MTAHYYFAYGSNMNPQRVRQRKTQFAHHQAGALVDYKLVFNKRSVKHPGAASANVMAEPGARTEGVVYKLSEPQQIEMMDPYEGYPIRYDRLILPIRCQREICDAWVYIANPAYISAGLKPARWYLNHLLAGASFLPASYVDQLQTIECLEQSNQEPD